MKRRTLEMILSGVGVAFAIGAAMICWQLSRRWHMVNLDHFFQAGSASASPHDGNRRNNLSQLPSGHQTFDGAHFNVAGLIQLANGTDAVQSNKPYPESVEGIPVKRTCRKIHLLHGATQSGYRGALVASLVLHFADGTTERLPIAYGQQVYDWWLRGTGDVPLAANTKVAWTGQNPEAENRKPHPGIQDHLHESQAGVRINTIDYVSALGPCAPFMIAVTVE